MASLGVLASLMQTMTPNMPQYNPMEEANQQALLQGRRSTNETALLTLADLKAKQEAEQLFLEQVKNNPDLARQLLGDGSILGSLGQGPGSGGMAPGAPPGPITQGTLGPGGVGGPQTIPAYPDASRYAGVSPQGGGPIPPDVMAQTMPQVMPPQGVLASLGPAGQPQMQPQAPRNPVLDMAAQNPRAAMLMQQQIQAGQDRQYAIQTQKLKMGSAIMGSLGQMAQGVTDQAGWDTLRQDAAQIDPKLAARLPQVYSKEARDTVVAQALDVKDSLTLQVQDLQAQAALVKARKEGRSTEVDNHLRALGVQPGQETPEQMRQALKDVQEGKVAVSGAQGVDAARIERTEKPLEGAAGKAASDLKLLRTMTDDVAALRTDAFTGPIVGRTGYLREQAGKMDQQEVAFRSTLQNMKDILGRLRSGANIPVPEMANLERLLPTANDLPEVFQAKMQSFQRALEQQLESITSVGTTGRQQLREETKPTTPRVGEKPQGQAQPMSQGSTGTGSKPASQMSREEIAAEIAAIKARGGA